jgi:hypothetical protein
MKSESRTGANSALSSRFCRRSNAAQSQRAVEDLPYCLVSGGAGKPLAKGGSHNYLVVSVDGNSIKVRMVKLP